jgi:hypothetical protein
LPQPIRLAHRTAVTQSGDSFDKSGRFADFSAHVNLGMAALPAFSMPRSLIATTTAVRL